MKVDTRSGLWEIALFAAVAMQKRVNGTLSKEVTAYGGPLGNAMSATALASAQMQPDHQWRALVPRAVLLPPPT